MRDFKVGRDINVGGDLHVVDQSQEFKPLAQCTNDELVQEREHRKALVARERADRNKRWLISMAVAGLLLFIASTWYWFHGKNDLFSLLSGAAGVVLALGTLRFGDEPTRFEGRQLEALDEIQMLLRERGIR
jgi:hypothetical protein